jgi:hypothetical protein
MGDQSMSKTTRLGLVVCLLGGSSLLVGPLHAGETERLNPEGVFKHPNFTRVITVKNPSKLVFVAGQTPSDIDYKCVSPGDSKVSSSR